MKSVLGYLKIYTENFFERSDFLIVQTSIYLALFKKFFYFNILHQFLPSQKNLFRIKDTLKSSDICETIRKYLIK